MSALDMANPIADELILLESSGLEVYDALHNEHVLVIAPILLFIADNPIASQLLNHLGGSAIKYGRICMADRDESLDVISTKRTLQDSLQQMTFSKAQKDEILARMKAFNFSRFRVKVHGNVCYHHKSFVGRDYKGLRWLSLLQAHTSQRDSKKFVGTVKVHLQNIYGNKQAPSRDIAKHFATVEHLCYICGGGLFNSNESMDDNVQEYRAVVSNCSELVHSGDYVELHPPFCEFKYGQLLTTIKLKSGRTLCLVQGFLAMQLPNGQPLLNDYECPLFTLSRTLFSVDSTRIQKAISMVHECGNHCKLQF
eukprot:Em0014g568a